MKWRSCCWISRKRNSFYSDLTVPYINHRSPNSSMQFKIFTNAMSLLNYLPKKRERESSSKRRPRQGLIARAWQLLHKASNYMIIPDNTRWFPGLSLPSLLVSFCCNLAHSSRSQPAKQNDSLAKVFQRKIVIFDSEKFRRRPPLSRFLFFPNSWLDKGLFVGWGLILHPLCTWLTTKLRLQRKNSTPSHNSGWTFISNFCVDKCYFLCSIILIITSDCLYLEFNLTCNWKAPKNAPQFFSWVS